MSAADVADHVAWLDYVKALWPVVVGLSALLSSVVVLWLSSRYATLKSHGDLVEKVSKHGDRITKVEELCAQTPTRQELQEDIAELGERMSAVETQVTSGFEGMRDQQRTTNDYLHLIIEKGLGSAGGRK